LLLYLPSSIPNSFNRPVEFDTTLTVFKHPNRSKIGEVEVNATVDFAEETRLELNAASGRSELNQGQYELEILPSIATFAP